MSTETNLYSGSIILSTTKEIIGALYKNGEIEVLEADLVKKQNQYVILTDTIYNEKQEEIFSGSTSAITKVKGNKLVKIPITRETVISGVRARNKEQIMTFDALLDPSIEVVTLTGSAGTGKTLQVLSAALYLKEKGAYEKIIISRQMTQVGNIELGILPGDLSEKMDPYLLNYMCNFSYLLGKNYKNGTVPVEELIEQYNIEFIPFQLIRGATFPNSLVILDESQNATRHEILTLGTRIGENSKLVLMGDLLQRDIKISKANTGLYQWVNHPTVQASPLTASVHLTKCERSAICKLFAKVFEEAE